MTHWHQHAWGDLPDGSRVMVITVAAEYRPGGRNREFQAVLICREDGLYRLWRDGRSRLLASGYQWPKFQRGEAENSLRLIVPSTWGTQRSSGCVLRQIPPWILKAKTANLARLLLAWYRTDQAARSERFLRDYQPMPLAVALPLAITVIPSTDLVVRALHSGVLLERLKRGLERIYVSQMAWLRAPSIEVALRALAHRFPTRLVLVRAEAYKSVSRILRVRRVRAAEYQFVGSQLRERYLEDFDYDKWTNQAALDDMIRLRIGEIPRACTMLWLHEIPVAFDHWPALDVEGMLGLEHAEAERCAAQDRKSMDAITFTGVASDSRKSIKDPGAGE